MTKASRLSRSAALLTTSVERKYYKGCVLTVQLNILVESVWAKTALQEKKKLFAESLVDYEGLLKILERRVGKPDPLYQQTQNRRSKSSKTTHSDNGQF